jgi:hypothetical protein
VGDQVAEIWRSKRTTGGAHMKVSTMAGMAQLLHAPVIDPDALMLGVSRERVLEIEVNPLPGFGSCRFRRCGFLPPGIQEDETND